MAYYNLTNVSSADSFYEMFVAVNSLSNGALAGFLLVLIAIVIFVIMKNQQQPTQETMLAVSMVVTLIAILFWALQLIPFRVIISPIVILVGTGMTMAFNR